MQTTAGSRRAAERKLKEQLAERTTQTFGQGDLNPSSTFRHLVDVWLAGLDLTGGLALSTRDLYERNMVQLVLPAFGHYALRRSHVLRASRRGLG